MARTAKITNANVAPSKNAAGLVGNTPVRAQDFNDLAGDYVSLSDANAQAISSAVSVAGIGTLTGGLVLGTESIGDAGALSTTIPVSLVTADEADMATTLADGSNVGQIKIVHCVATADSFKVTPTTTAGAYTKVTFTTIGETAIFIWTGTPGWAILSRAGGAAAAADAVAGLPVIA